jgi:hypothetical protein
MALTAVAIGGLMLGFLAGLLTFQRSQQWCVRCGMTKACPNCRTQPHTTTPASDRP